MANSRLKLKSELEYEWANTYKRLENIEALAKLTWYKMGSVSQLHLSIGFSTDMDILGM